MKIGIDIKKFLILSGTFVFFTIIGTLSHELSHIAVAKLLGYKTTLHYGSMDYKYGHSPNLSDKLVEIYTQNETEIENGIDFEQREFYENGFEKIRSHGLLIAIGGPAQTVLTGIICLLILFFRRKKIRENGFKLLDWLAVFLSLFWLREIFNLLIGFVNEIIAQNGNYFGGDEKNISLLLNLHPGAIPIILGITGLLVSIGIIFHTVSKKLRPTFILSGLVGGTFGFILWMEIVGPRLLP